MQDADEVEVIGRPGEDECSHEMFVSIRWDRKEGLAVPLSQAAERPAERLITC